MDKKFLIYSYLIETEAVICAVGLGYTNGTNGYLVGMILFMILSFINLLATISMTKLTIKHGEGYRKPIIELTVQAVVTIALFLLAEFMSRHINGHAYFYETIKAMFG